MIEVADPHMNNPTLTTAARQLPSTRTKGSFLWLSALTLALSLSSHATVFEAEDYDDYGPMSDPPVSSDIPYLATTSNASGGHALGGFANGEWLSYNIDVATSGTYNLTARLGTTQINRAISFSSNGIDISGNITFGPTNGTYSYEDFVVPVYLEQGSQTIKVDIYAGNFSFDRWELDYTGWLAPEIDAGSDLGVTLPANTVALNGSVISDDNLPEPPTTRWRQVSGPSLVDFGNASVPTTTASFRWPGSYTLEFSATDGYWDVSQTINVTVADGPRTTISSNSATTIQAEAYRGGGNGTGFMELNGSRPSVYNGGNGTYFVGNAPNGEWTSYDVVVPQAGYYTLTARVKSAKSGKLLRFYSGKNDLSGPITVNSSGAAFVDVSAGVFLPPGRQTLKLSFEIGGFNIDYFRFEPQTPSTLLVDNGNATAEIVISETPTRTVLLAAEELRKYIQKMSGANMTITSSPTENVPNKIYVGQSQASDLLVGPDPVHILDDGFRMISGENYLVLRGPDANYDAQFPANEAEWDALTGNNYWTFAYAARNECYSKELKVWSLDGRGSLNAVHEFLRNLGVRWYFPGDDGEVVPELTTIGLPRIDISVNPQFNLRWFQQQANAFKNGEVGLNTADTWRSSGRDETLWQLRMGGNDGRKGLAGPFVHGLNSVHTRAASKGFDFFADYDGNPPNWSNMSHNGVGDPRLTSTALRAEIANYAGFLFGPNFNETAVSIMPVDGFAGMSYSENATLYPQYYPPEAQEGGKFSDYVFEFANAVANTMNATLNPPGSDDKKYLTMSAYGQSRLPPVQNFDLHPNIALIYVRVRSFLSDMDDNDFQRGSLMEWIPRVKSGLIYVYDKHRHANIYSTNGRSGIPCFYPRSLADDAQFLQDKIDGFYAEVYRNNTEYYGDTNWHSLAANHLNLYVAYRLFWNADLDIDVLLEEYYTGFYGPAAPKMKELIEYCEQNWMYVNTNDPIFVPHAKGLVSEALGLVSAGTKEHRRVKLLKDYLYNRNTQ